MTNTMRPATATETEMAFHKALVHPECVAERNGWLRGSIACELACNALVKARTRPGHVSWDDERITIVLLDVNGNAHTEIHVEMF